MSFLVHWAWAENLSPLSYPISILLSFYSQPERERKWLPPQPVPCSRLLLHATCKLNPQDFHMRLSSLVFEMGLFLASVKKTVCSGLFLVSFLFVFVYVICHHWTHLNFCFVLGLCHQRSMEYLVRVNHVCSSWAWQKTQWLIPQSFLFWLLQALNHLGVLVAE